MSTKQESATVEMAPPPYQNPQDQRYPPPHNQQHYPPPNQPYYPPPQQQQPYYPPPMQQMQTSNNVTIVNNTPGTQTVVVKRGVNHCLHCCITIFFFPWIIVWMILCCVYGC